MIKLSNWGWFSQNIGWTLVPVLFFYRVKRVFLALGVNYRSIISPNLVDWKCSGISLALGVNCGRPPHKCRSLQKPILDKSPTWLECCLISVVSSEWKTNIEPRRKLNFHPKKKLNPTVINAGAPAVIELGNPVLKNHFMIVIKILASRDMVQVLG